jgi:hypothetical protein
LRLWADQDEPLVTVVRRLVLAVLSLLAARPVHPADGIAPVDIQAAHAANLVRAAARQALEVDH